MLFIIDGLSLGSVTFNTGSVPQSRTVTFPVTNNNIAMEPDKHYMLKLRNLGNLRLGDPETMNITVVDDNSKNRITIFEQLCLQYQINNFKTIKL